MNPVKQLRLAYNLTQEELALKVGMTRQSITDLETGLWIKPGPSLLSVLPADQREAFVEEYKAWLHKERLENVRHIDFSKLDNSSFKAWLESVGGSVKGGCRAFCLQPSIATSYINHGQRWGMIAKVLIECGLSDEYVTLLAGLPRHGK